MKGFLQKAIASSGEFSLLVLGLLLILALTLWIFRLPVWESLKLLEQGALGDKFGIGRTASKATPLILTSLGIIVAWRAGMFNIGGEGQFVMGGIGGAYVAKVLFLHGMPPHLVLTLILIMSAIFGGAYGIFAGWLKVSRGVDIVISTILLNFIAIQILKWLVSGPLSEKSGGLPMTDQLPNSAMLWKIDPQTDFHAGFFVAIVMSIFIWIVLYRTAFGFKLRVVGDNPFVAVANRISSSSVQLKAMAISGALCGLAGGIEYTAISGQVGLDFNQNWGFLAIPVALLAGLHPLVAILSGLYFGGLIAGSINLERFSHSGDTLIYVVQGVAVLGLVGLQAAKAKKKLKGGT